MNNVIVLNVFENHVPATGITHADEVIDGDVDVLAALDASTKMVLLQPSKAVHVTFDGSAPVTAGHGFTYAAGVPFVLNPVMAKAMKFVWAVANETGAISVQELTR